MLPPSTKGTKGDLHHASLLNNSISRSSPPVLPPPSCPPYLLPSKLRRTLYCSVLFCTYFSCTTLVYPVPIHRFSPHLSSPHLSSPHLTSPAAPRPATRQNLPLLSHSRLPIRQFPLLVHASRPHHKSSLRILLPPSSIVYPSDSILHPARRNGGNSPQPLLSVSAQHHSPSTQLPLWYRAALPINAAYDLIAQVTILKPNSDGISRTSFSCPKPSRSHRPVPFFSSLLVLHISQLLSCQPQRSRDIHPHACISFLQHGGSYAYHLFSASLRGRLFGISNLCHFIPPRTSRPPSITIAKQK